MEEAIKPGAVQLHENAPNNIAFQWGVGGGDADAALASAEVRISQRLINQRLIPTAIEPRAVLAQYAPGLGDMTVWSTTQVPYFLRLFIAACSRPQRGARARDRPRGSAAASAPS